jgi:hypothetical protein
VVHRKDTPAARGTMVCPRRLIAITLDTLPLVFLQQLGPFCRCHPFRLGTLLNFDFDRFWSLNVVLILSSKELLESVGQFRFVVLVVEGYVARFTAHGVGVAPEHHEPEKLKNDCFNDRACGYLLGAHEDRTEHRETKESIA